MPRERAWSHVTLKKFCDTSMIEKNKVTTRRNIFPQGKRERKPMTKPETDPSGRGSQSDVLPSCLLPRPPRSLLGACWWQCLFFSHAKRRDWHLTEKRTLDRSSRLLSPPSCMPTNCARAQALSGIFIAAFKFTQLSIKRGNGAPFTAASGDCPNIL